MFLVIIDAHSKWMEVMPMKTATAFTTIEELRWVFAKFGIPEFIVSDNGLQFIATEFEQFYQKNGIRHIAAYHPASNGLAEKAVQIFKQAFKKLTSSSIQHRVSQLLLQYRVTPHTTTGVSPAELLLNYRSRTRLDCIRPSLQK